MELEFLELDSVGPEDLGTQPWRVRISFWVVVMFSALVLSIGCPDPAPQTVDHEVQVFELTIEKRQIAVGGDEFRVRQGQQVRIRWLTDEPISIHLHGYDIEASLEPDTPVYWNFEANATGRFPIEVHGSDMTEQRAPTHDHSDGHDHPSPEPAPAAAPTNETLLYFEVYPR